MSENGGETKIATRLRTPRQNGNEMVQNGTELEFLPSPNVSKCPRMFQVVPVHKRPRQVHAYVPRSRAYDGMGAAGGA